MMVLLRHVHQNYMYSHVDQIKPRNFRIRCTEPPDAYSRQFCCGGGACPWRMELDIFAICQATCQGIKDAPNSPKGNHSALRESMQ